MTGLETFTLDKLQVLQKDNVRMKDPKGVEEKIKRLIAGGHDKLQIITDFDRTLSKQHHEGVQTKSSYCVYETVSSLPKSFVDSAQALYNRFRVIEDDPSLTVEEKLPHMEEWWVLNEKLFLGLKLDYKEIDDAVATSGVHLRVGTHQAFDRLEKSNVPVLVFSAGLGDVVRRIMHFHKIDRPNVHVISNFFKHDGDFIINGFQGTLIHIYNKNEHALKNSVYFEDLSHRMNVVLMGDSLGDANMHEGVSSEGTILKIGFLSVNIDDYLPQYLEKFDIVLLDDQTMDVFNSILDNIL